MKSRQSAAAALPGVVPTAHARVERAYAQALFDVAAEGGWQAPSALPDPLPVPQYIGLMESAAQTTGCEDLGLRVGARMHAGSFVAYGAVLLSCARFGDALAQTQRFEALAHDLGRTELRVQGGDAEYRWHCPWLAAHPSRHLPESVLAGIHAFGRWIAQGPLPVREVAFPHPAPSPAHQDRLQAFFGAPVRFGAAVTAARFDAALLHRRIPSANPDVLPVLEAHATRLLTAREAALAAAPGSLALRVQRCVAERLAHDGARVADVAQQLGLSARTLQRRLRDEGQPFQRLLDTTRRELAAQYLRQPHLSLTEIAFLLGYREPSSFTHAHRAWTGLAPHAWRERRGESGGER